MTTVLLIIHMLVTLALIGVVLIQRSEGGGLGVGTSQGMGSFMSGRGTANLLTRTTAILAAIFMMMSLALALLNRGTTVGGNQSSILDLPARPTAPATTAPAPSTAPAAATPPAATAPSTSTPNTSTPNTNTLGAAPAASTPPAVTEPASPATTTPPAAATPSVTPPAATQPAESAPAPAAETPTAPKP